MAIFEYKLPELGEGIHEGEIVKWLIKSGDEIEEDQIILEVQNDKAVVEVPSPVSGKVKDIIVPEGTVSVVGDTLVTIEIEGEAPNIAAHGAGHDEQEDKSEKQEEKSDQNNQKNQKVKTVEKSEEVTKTEVQVANKKVLATPSVRKFAREQGISISDVPATGPHGRITREDIKSFASGDTRADSLEEVKEAAEKVTNQAPEQERQEAASPEVPVSVDREERVPLKGIRKIIAQAMVKSVYTAPHVTIMDEVEVTRLVEFRNQAKPLAEKKGIKLTYLAFIVKALVAGLRKYPTLNASIDDEKNEIVYKHYFNIGIATDTENGLLVPVIKDADRKSIWMIADEIRDLATRGREGKLTANELKGSTMTITNIGSAGGMFFTPVINYPEVAILGTGRINEKPTVRNGEVIVAPIMTLSLSFDHRIIDGATAQYFVNYIKELLEDPQLLILEV
jgi:pyruvate dehydrogenase E2 component (dihydrolipoamide acetyltransferase)